MKKRIPMKNFNSDLSCIFKNRLDKLGYSTWKELTDKLEIDNNGYIDTSNGSWKGRKLDIAFAKAINKLAEEIKNIKEK